MDYSHFLIIAGLILINAYFVAAELRGQGSYQPDRPACGGGDWAARLTSKALDKLDVYLSASQIGITVASLALGRAIQDWVEPLVASLSKAGEASRVPPVWAGWARFSAGSSGWSASTSGGWYRGSRSASCRSRPCAW